MAGRAIWSVVFAVGFIVLATANSAGYRYAASDQAFYVPAVLRHIDPALFPRDAPLVDSQARLTLVDEAIASTLRLTGTTLPRLFVAFYLVTLVVLVSGALRLGRHFLDQPWSLAALAAALSLRHAIAKTGANTLEGYFHPRQLAFAISVWAIVCFLERRRLLCAALLIAAAAIHPTTALWFTVLLSAAAVVEYRRVWRRSAIIVCAAAAAAVWMATAGPLAGRFVRMDPAWLAVLADKDYLFPAGWPLDAWLTNLVTVPVIVFCWRARQRLGRARPGEDALVIGCLALAALFFAWLPFNTARVALAVQLQVSRLFWVLDFLATIYLIWALAEYTPSRGRAAAIAVLLVIAAGARGAYSMFVEFPDRKLFALDITNPEWRDAMAWARSTPVGSGWLADPLHAVRYGSSVRAAGERDVFLEQVKDSAIAMYDRRIAMRVADRERAVAAHPWNTVEGARALASDYGLDFLVVDRELALPEAHRSGSLHIYRLR